MRHYSPIIKEPQVDYTSFLLEKTFDIDRDVDFIYNTFFKDFINKFLKKEFMDYSKIVKNYKSIHSFFDMKKDDVIFGKINSSKLRSQDCVNANKVNPVEIFCGIFESGNIYSTYSITTGQPYILLSLVKDAVIAYIKNKPFWGNIKHTFENEFTVQRIKSSIIHELSHWIDDSLHKGFLTSLVDLADWLDKPHILKLKQKDVSITYFEINSQIHGIKNLKRSNSKEWNNFELDDIFFKYPALHAIGIKVYENFGKEVLEIWEKYLMKRMAREGLLGKNMRSFINVKILESRNTI